MDNDSQPRPDEVSVVVIHPRSERVTRRFRRWQRIVSIVLLAGLVFGSGLGSGYFLWGRDETEQANADRRMAAMVNTINPKEGFMINATYGDVGPKLVAAGAIDMEKFQTLYQESGQPLSEQQMATMTDGSPDQIVFTRDNAHFLLNWFWALGLANQNPVLDSGLLKQASDGQIDRFASTGGWTLGASPVTELYSSASIVTLSADQQARVEDVAQAVFRPCCNNPTHFPDCNHGMAMLGMLELMASQDATTEEMLQAAKYANAFWFPQQTLEQALFFKATQKLDYPDIEAKMLLGGQFSSASGFGQVHQQLVAEGLGGQEPRGGGNCGV